MHNIKFVDGSDDTIEILAIPYDGPFEGKDLDGERFSHETDLCLPWFEERPVLYEHGTDDEMGTTVVGRTKSIREDDEGLWTQAQLDKSVKYFKAIESLIKKGKLFASSGAMGHLVKKSVSGDIERWPWIETTLTVKPINVFATVEWPAAKSHFKSLGVDDDRLEEVKAKMDAAEKDALPDSDYAYIDKDGGRHLPVNDEAHAKNALARFDQTEFESSDAKAAAASKILSACKAFGIDVADDDPVRMAAKKSLSDEALKSLEGSYEDLLEDLSDLLNPQTPFGTQAYCCIIATYPDYVICQRYEATGEGDYDTTYWKVAYTIGEDSEPVLGKATEVEQTYVPTKSFSYDGPLALDAQSLVRHATALAARTKGLHERRIEEGRILSVANQSLIASSVKGLSELAETLQAVLDATSTMVREQAKAEALATPDAMARQLEILSLYADTL